MHERDVLMKLCLDVVRGTTPTLTADERQTLQRVLELCIINAPPEFRLYVLRLGAIGQLHPTLDRHFRSGQRLPSPLERRILEEGLTAVDDTTIAALALNFTALQALQEMLTTVVGGDPETILHDPATHRAGARAVGQIMGLDAQRVGKTWLKPLMEETRWTVAILRAERS